MEKHEHEDRTVTVEWLLKALSERDPKQKVMIEVGRRLVPIFGCGTSSADGYRVVRVCGGLAETC